VEYNVNEECKSTEREMAEVISLTLGCLFGRHRPERKAFDW
jgi:hypothetical protein